MELLSVALREDHSDIHVAVWIPFKDIVDVTKRNVTVSTAPAVRMEATSHIADFDTLAFDGVQTSAADGVVDLVVVVLAVWLLVVDEEDLVWKPLVTGCASQTLAMEDFAHCLDTVTFCWPLAASTESLGDCLVVLEAVDALVVDMSLSVLDAVFAHATTQMAFVEGSSKCID